MSDYGDKLYCLGNMYEIAARGESKDPVADMKILLDKYSLEKDNLISSLQVQITNFKKQEKQWRINHVDNGRTIGVQELDLQKLRLENSQLKTKIYDLKEELKTKDKALKRKQSCIQRLSKKDTVSREVYLKPFNSANRNDYINNYNHSTLNFDVEPLVDPLKTKCYHFFKNQEPMSNWVKPPIGIMPKTIWIEKRIDELLECINRYHEAGRGPGKSDSTHALFAKWMKEVIDLKTILDNDK